MTRLRDLSATVLLASAGVAAIACAAPAAAQEQSQTISLPAQPLGDALIELSRQADIVVIADPDATRGRMAPAVNGRMTPAEALRRLLVGSGLRASRGSNGSYTVTAVGSNAAPQVTVDDRPIVVTGTRIEGTEPTTQTVVITRDEIDQRGYSSVEDIINSLPQNQNNFNAVATSNEGVQDGLNSNFTFGESAANLRGLGVSNVLVLVNGRRQSSSGIFGLFADDDSLSATSLGTIPFAAIERVEIILDGASSIYGADAVGGVINFILRSDFSGGEFSIRHEGFGTFGEETLVSGVYGTTWSGGHLTVSGEWAQQDAITPEEIGYTTDDRRQQSDSPFAIDQRQVGSRLGIYSASTRALIGFLPAGDDGSPITDADLDGSSGRLTTDPTVALVDNVPYQIAPRQERYAFNLDIEHALLPDLIAFAGASYSASETTRNTPVFGGTVSERVSANTVPAGSAFNASSVPLRFGGVIAGGLNGAFPQPVVTTNESERYGGRIGLEYAIGQGWDVTAVISRDESKTQLSRFNDLEFSLGGFQDLVGDGSVNPFVDLASQADFADAVQIDDFLGARNEEITTGVTQITLDADGPLFELPGGTARMAVGGELRRENLEVADAFLLGGAAGDRFFPITDPTRDLIAVYGELSLPVLDPLELRLSARYDAYDASAQSDLGDVDSSYDAFSPGIGAALRPTDWLKLRANWQRSFRAPTIRQLYRGNSRRQVSGFLLRFGFPLRDPFAPTTGTQPPVSFGPSANPDLEGETSESFSLGVDIEPPFAPGLRISVNYTDIGIENAFSDSASVLRDTDLFTAIGPDGLGAITRDENGFLIDFAQYPINIARADNEALDFDISYRTSTSFGDLNFLWRSTRSITNERLILESIEATRQELVGTDRGQPKWSHFASANWQKDNLGATLVINWVGGYDNVFAAQDLADRFDPFNYYGPQLAPLLDDDGNLVQPIDDYATFDLILQYEFESAGLRVGAGATNLFDSEPPYFASVSGPGFDPSKHSPYGRRIFVRLTKEF